MQPEVRRLALASAQGSQAQAIANLLAEVERWAQSSSDSTRTMAAILTAKMSYRLDADVLQNKYWH
jgi:hypothetical protein